MAAGEESLRACAGRSASPCGWASADERLLTGGDWALEGSGRTPAPEGEVSLRARAEEEACDAACTACVICFMVDGRLWATKGWRKLMGVRMVEVMGM